MKFDIKFHKIVHLERLQYKSNRPDCSSTVNEYSFDFYKQAVNRKIEDVNILEDKEKSKFYYSRT